MNCLSFQNNSINCRKTLGVALLSGAISGSVAQLIWGEAGAALILALASVLAVLLSTRLVGTQPRAAHVESEAPAVVWFTGLPSSGKTTLSLLLREQLIADGRRVEHLDGDAVRAIVPGIGFTRNDRNDHIRRMGFTCSRLEAHGVTVLASFVSPYRESRDFVRGLCKNFIEVYLSTDLEECTKRDVKGLYQEVKDGTRAGMTGVDDPYEPPLKPELILDTAKQSKEECVRLILEKIGAQRGKVESQTIASTAEKCHGSSVAA